jgi:Reverse transcriptase (RNA-dependent DNA polymerase)
MCGCSLLGNREVSRSANDAKRCWSAAGRRGAVAADVRAREVRPGHSSSEADEQRQTTGSGVGGAKGRGRGEEEFLGFSYGFRPQPSQHDALDALVVGITRTKVNHILDADIRSFFDEVSQEWLVRFLEHRIGDRRIIRLIQKWLRAGVLEQGVVTVRERLNKGLAHGEME